MTEENKPGEMLEQQGNQEGETPTEQQGEFDKERAMALIEKLRRENRDLGKTAKRAQELEAEAAKRKEAEMTELQKAQKRAEEAEARAAKLERESLQREIAAKVGLPAKLATRLQGETAEEMEADAKAILEDLPKPPPQPKPGPGIVPANPGGNGSNGETDAARRLRLGL